MSPHPEHDRRERHRLKAAGHTGHCAARLVWGDGECECGATTRPLLEAWVAATKRRLTHLEAHYRSWTPEAQAGWDRLTAEEEAAERAYLVALGLRAKAMVDGGRVSRG